MGKRHRSVDVEAIAFSRRPHGAGEIPQAVGREHGRPVEGRDKESAGQVRHVVLNAMKLSANRLAGRRRKRRQGLREFPGNASSPGSDRE